MENQSRALLHDLKERIKPFLRQYLESRGVKIQQNGHFTCINSKHADKKTPSGHLVPPEEHFWTCFGCGSNGDIFTAAHWLEGFPLSGVEFIHENIYVLAQRFSIPYEPIKMSEQDIYLMQLRQLYRHAADTLVEFPDCRALLDERGWSTQLCADMRVGVVRSWQDFRTRLMNKGDYTVKFLEDNGIYSTYFNPNCITFTIFDEHGNPVGFAARDSRWGKGVPNIDKFKTTEARIQIFRKREILYGLHLVRHRNVPIQLVEGYSDVLTALQCGLEGFVGVLTSGLTDEQIAILQKYNKNQLDLALDFDAESKTGQNKMEETIDEVISGKRNLRVQVVDLSVTAQPGQSIDPDEFLKAQPNPREAWWALPRTEAFQWRLERFRGMPPELTSERMIQLILNESQHARQEVMLKQLSDFTGLRLQALQADLDAHLYETDRKRRDQALSIQQDIMRRLKFADPVKADEIMFDGAKRLKALRRDTESIVTVHTSVEMAEVVKQKFLDKGEGLAGLRTGWDRYDKYMGGFAKEDCYLVLGGMPHTGKTSWFAQLQWNLAALNDHVCILVHTIDDATSQILPKFVSIVTGIPITHVAHPKRYLKSEAQWEQWNWGWRTVTNRIASGHLEVRDATYGRSVHDLDRWIDEKRKHYGGERHIVAFLDNFHKVHFEGEKIRERFKAASERMKEMSQSGGVSIAVTAELLKGMDRKNPQLSDLMETVQIEHDATIAALCHNDLQADPNSDMHWIDDREPDPKHQKKPFLEIRVKKNKNIDGAFKGDLLFQFDPTRSLCWEIEADAAAACETKEPPKPPTTPTQGMLKV